MVCRYEHRVQFYETDLMGIMHHSNYLRVFEEARVSWAQQKGILDYQKPETASYLAVLNTQVRHAKPCFFGDQLEIGIEARKKGLLLEFQYEMKNLTRGSVSAYGYTTHVYINQNFKAVRLPADVNEILEKEKWTETWHSNL
jgi:acyl-CoA thioester hydrolase